LPVQPFRQSSGIRENSARRGDTLAKESGKGREGGKVAER